MTSIVRVPPETVVYGLVIQTSRKRSQSEAEITSSPVRSKSAGPITVESSPPVVRDKQDAYRTKQLKEEQKNGPKSIRFEARTSEP